ncbi:MAG: GWxTD domain-containing protein [Flavobacteriales bacterium]|nr:GWxTD domain-containing protein [Flavobacteriales bacterium]
MYKIYLLSTWLILISVLAGHSQSLEVYHTKAFFLHPEDGPYLESYLAINGGSVQYKPNEEGDLQGKVEVIAIYLQGDSIVYFDKYEVRSPVTTKENAEKGNFMDVQRIPLPNGAYRFEMQVKDLNGGDKIPPNTFSEMVLVNFSEDSVSISDIELVESYQRTEERNNFVKGGVKLIPYTSNFYPEAVQTMIFYTEIYNIGKFLGDEQGFLLNYYIESQDSEQKLGEYSKFRKEMTKEVNVLFSQFSIATLPSGNYNLVVEVRDRSNQLLVRRKLFFQRSNPNLPVKVENLAALDMSRSFVMNIPKDSLFECIRCVGPISTSSERQYAETQLLAGEEDLMRRYFQHFWEKRSLLEPESLWVSYSAQVKKVQREYGGMIMRGYETDRGRIYLQYGQPNSVEVRNMDPGLYPYEIWHYYKIANTSNGKFIFYDPEMVDEMYELLHSNLPGEPSDPAWHYKLQNLRTGNLDRLMDINSSDSRAREFWNNPK